jgi:hypothetical protein
MITIIGNTRVQTPSDGNLLTKDGIFSKQVYLGEGAEEWEEVLDEGQMDVDQLILEED